MDWLEYVDLTIKFIIALLVPLCWAVIFYPLLKKLRRGWPVLVAASTLFSFFILVVKEIAGQIDPVYNEITAYLFGIFFGTALLSFLFNLKNRWLFVVTNSNTPLQTPPNGAPIVSPEVFPRKNLPFHGRHHLRLRHLLQGAILAEERGKYFYEELAKTASDPKTKELCAYLAREEIDHKIFIEKILYQWLPVPFDAKAVAIVEEEMARWDIYLNPPGTDSTKEEMIRYAIEQEKRMADFYLSFEKSFPYAWKRINVQMLVMSERSHMNKLLLVYPK